MKKWITRSVVGLTMLVSGAGAAFMVLAEMGDRKLARHVDVAVTPVAFRSDAASIERGAYLFKSRGGDDSVRRRLHAVRLGANGAPRRQARRPTGDDHAERGIQPLR